MTIKPELLMAYADGELDLLTAKRVERAIAGDPALVEEVERHRLLRNRLASGFAPIAQEPVPHRLAALLRTNVIPMPVQPAKSILTPWTAAAAMAACLVLGVSIGSMTNRGPVAARGNGLYASGQLAEALDNQPSGTTGNVGIALSFRDHEHDDCRVFSSRAIDGIACRDETGWALRRTMPSSSTNIGRDYAQAGSAAPGLMTAAQDMMIGRPFTTDEENTARATGWRRQ